jgi:hypothetical protein
VKIFQRFLPVIGLLATTLTVAACSTAGGNQPAARSTGQASSMAGGASTSTPAGAGATTPGGSVSKTAGDSPGQRVSPPPSKSPGQAGFASALAAWKSAAAAPAATMNTYLQRAADDLRASGNSSYKTATTELTYLAQLPATNDTPAQQAKARSYVQALDSFFGTPGLLS